MGHIVDLKTVTQDCLMLAGVTDHITPWKACYRNTELFGGDIEHLPSLLRNRGGFAGMSGYLNVREP